jgi:cell division protein FtsQ
VRELRAYGGLQEGIALLGLGLDETALRLRRHPWVRAARVVRRLPDTIQVKVEEYEPALVVALDDLYYADAEGHVFKRVASGDMTSLPVLTGIDRSAAIEEAEATAVRVRAAVELNEAFAGLRGTLGRLDELHWDDDLGWTAMTSTAAGAMTLELGKGGPRQLLVAARGVAALEKRGQRPERVWADRQDGDDVVQVRMAATTVAGTSTLMARAR